MKLYEHQTKNIEQLLPLERTGDWSDPGTGKTAVALNLIVAREATTLVLCPKTLMEVAWVDDGAKFFPNLVILCSYAPHSTALFDNDANIFIINVDGAKWLSKQKSKFFKKFDMLILDESSKFKHYTSARSRAVNKIKNHFHYRHAMSGTPATNGIIDMWHQMYLIDDGKRLGKVYYHFRMSTCTSKQVGPLPQHKKWTEKEGAAVAVGGLIADISVRSKFEDVVEIPETRLRYINFKLSPKNKTAYDTMKEEAILEFQDNDVNAVNAAVLRQKLLQIASGAVYDTASKAKVMATTRYELVNDLIREREHSLVFFLWSHQKVQIEKLLNNPTDKVKYAVIDGSVTSNTKRTEIIRDYEAGKYQTLLLHPASAAHGITLIRASTTIWPSPTDNLEFWEQAYRRMVRAGQKQKTETIMITAKETLEKNVYAKLQAKKGDMTNLLELFE